MPGTELLLEWFLAQKIAHEDPFQNLPSRVTKIFVGKANERSLNPIILVELLRCPLNVRTEPKADNDLCRI